MATAFADRPGDGRDPILAAAPHRIGRVALRVRDLDTVAGFYRSVIGLQQLERGRNRAYLGTSSQVLIELEQDAEAPVSDRREAGLFHTAFLLPDRADLGAWLSHALDRGTRLTGASDHLVSEAIYLDDPEGNGIEIYADRPSDLWPRANGMIAMASDPLDLDGLVRAAAGRSWSGYPDDGVVGHVHLQVGSLAEADAFYGDLLGFDIMARYPGASFYGSGGYHHQLAGNIWNSRGASVRSDGRTGLADVEIRVAEAVIEKVRSKAPAEESGTASGAVSLRDPWGNSITLRPA